MIHGRFQETTTDKGHRQEGYANVLFPARVSPVRGQAIWAWTEEGCRGPGYTGVVTSNVTDPRINGDETFIGRTGLLTLVFADIPHT